MSASKDHLVDKQIIDVNGRVTTVKVRRDDAHGLTPNNAPFHIAPPSASGSSFTPKDDEGDLPETARISTDLHVLESGLSDIGVTLRPNPRYPRDRVYASARVQYQRQSPTLLSRLLRNTPTDEWELCIHPDGRREVLRNGVDRGDFESAPQSVQAVFLKVEANSEKVMNVLYAKSTLINRRFGD